MAEFVLRMSGQLSVFVPVKLPDVIGDVGGRSAADWFYVVGLCRLLSEVKPLGR